MASQQVEKKLVKSKSGLRIVSVSDTQRSPFELPEPPWTPDDQITECMECNTRFAFMKRRHHCRRCGNIYCDSCCKHKLPLPRMCFVDPVRMCGKCAKTTQKENEFFDKHIKTLMNGADFSMTGTTLGPEANTVFSCKLTGDNRYINMDGEIQHDPVDLSKVESVQIMTSADPDGNTVATGIAIKFKDNCSESQSIKLLTENVPNKKQSMTWIAAMQKAVRMIYEGRSPDTP